MKIVAPNDWQNKVFYVHVVQPKLLTEIFHSILLYYTWESVLDYPESRKIFQLVRRRVASLIDFPGKIQKEILSCILGQSVLSQRLKERCFCRVDAELIFIRTGQHFTKIDAILLDLILQIGVIQEPHPLFFHPTEANNSPIDFLLPLLLADKGRLNHGDIKGDMPQIPPDFLIDKIGQHGSISSIPIDGYIINMNISSINLA